MLLPQQLLGDLEEVRNKDATFSGLGNATSTAVASCVSPVWTLVHCGALSPQQTLLPYFVDLQAAVVFSRFCHMYHTACSQLFVHSPRSYALVSVQLSHLDSNKKIHHIISIELQRLKYGLNLLYCSMFKHYPLNFIKCINKYSFDVL